MFVSNVVRAFSHGVKVCGYNGRSSSIVMLIFLCLLSGGTALAQAKVTVESEISKSGSLVLEVRGVDDASVSATPVERISPNGKQLYCAYDIDITKDGREWQPEPEQPAMVSMENTNFADGQLLDIYHEGANGLEFVATVASENGKITFPAHSFSVYIVAAAGDYARLKVNLHQADGSVVTIYVKKLDLTQGDFNRIVYNPGMGADNLAAGVKCMGWIAKENYTKNDVPNFMTFDGVRDSITNRLNSDITDGTELDFYTMLFKSYSVLYLDENDAVIDNDVILFRADAGITSMPYTVSTNYTPRSNTSKFEGWMVNSSADGSHIVGHDNDSRNYTLNTEIEITGNVTFNVIVSEGFWLIYHENGKGATYKAADFIHAGDVTERPTLTMLRNGYEFAGWYTGEPATQYGDPTGSEFVFGQHLEANTHVYAKWNVNEKAKYTVIVWKQNVTCNGYDFEEAINLEGTPNTEVSTVSSVYDDPLNANTRYAKIDGTPRKYTGFYLNNFNEHVRIAPEGNSIVNVYYDRIEYTVKFIYYRMINSGRDAGRYEYATNKKSNSQGQHDAEGDNYLCAKWTNERRNGEGDKSFSDHPVCTYTNCGDTVMGNYTYHYYPITAKYGQSIADKWPQYNKFGDFDERELSSWVMMIGALDRGEGSGQGSVKGLISIMDEHILGKMTSSNGNYLVAKYSNADQWTYNIWFPQVDDEGYTERTCTTYNSVNYYLEYEILARTGSGEDGQHQPSFIGFSNVSGNRRGNNNVMDYYYSREEHIINYMDGAYYNGNNIKLNDYSPSGQLREVTGVAYGSNISSYGDYVHTAPTGFVFEGWYVDEPCTRPFVFDTKMPSANVTIYAKWRQIQYRVFLHPNVSTDDETIFWGSDNQALNFRIDYGNKISVPTGTRDDYEFVGWFTDEECEHPFSENVVVLNDDNTVAYDKTTEFTDPMDKWGNGATWNAELYYEDDDTHEILPRNPERFWITKKYDLYGKWRAKLRGANGITVVYEDNDGAGSVPTEELLYQDNVDVVAGNACSYVDDTKKFSHWVLQHYNGESYEDIPNSCIYPGAIFTALKADSKMVVTRWFDPENPEDYIETGFSPSSTRIHPISPDDPYVEFQATYTIKLRAEYEDVENPEHTFIEWFWNDGTNTVQIDGTSISTPDLGINVAVNPPVPTRPGYNFKGWYRSNESGATITGCNPNFLFYNGAFYKESTYTNAVATVAADKYGSPEYMYAIWEPIVDFTFDALCPGDQIALPTRNLANVLISGSWEAITGDVSGTTYTASGLNDNITFTPDPSTCAQPKEFAITINTPDVPNVSSYDYIWKGTSTDWNTASNWYVYNNGYSIATEMPTLNHNIYIGPSPCVKANWPLQTDEAYAKDITIARDANLTVPAGTTLNIAGNLNNIGTLDATDGIVEFCGTSEREESQTISHDIKFGKVTFNNRGGDIVPRGSMTIIGAATFRNGNVVGDVTFGENSIIENAEGMTFYSFVDGTVTKEGDASGFTFPTGQDNVLGKIKVSSRASNVSVRYFHNYDGFTIDEYPRWWNSADNCAGNDPQFDHVSNYEYWNVATTAPLNATLTVSAKGGDAHFNEHTLTHEAADIYGAFWTGSCWQNVGGANRTVSDGPYGTISVDVTLPATRSTYDKILTLGSINHSTILPIELMSFTAVCNGRYVNLEWTTASERNNDYFIVERSDDAINFTEIARIAGAGNSIEQLDYTYTDYSATSGDNYYRLVQVDYDGTRTVSEIVVAICSEADGEPDVQVFPNPFHNDLTIHMENFGGTTVSIEVYDMLGRIVMQKTIGVDGSSEETMLQLDNLSNGTYNVRISTKELVINKQVVKN